MLLKTLQRTAFASLVGLSSLTAFGQDDAPLKGLYENVITLPARTLYGAEEVYRASGAEFKNYQLNGWRIDRRSGSLTTGLYQAGAQLTALGGQFAVPSCAKDERVYLHIADEFEIESNYDSGQLKLSTDGGTTWQTVYTVSGVSGARTAQVNITRFAGKTVQLALELSADASEQGAGWTVSEIVITKGDRKPAVNTKIGARGLADNEIKITAVHDDNFPEAVYVDFEYTEDGVHNVDKTLSDFVFDYKGENTICQPSLFKAVESAQRDVDLVFLMDNSGSMGSIQADVIAKTQGFVNNISAVANVNFAMIRLGIDASPGVAPFVTKEYFDDKGALLPFTNDVAYFNQEMGSRNVTNGSTERSYEAVKLASELTFRSSAQKIFILVCNADIEERTNTTITNQGTTTLKMAVDMANGVGASIYSYIPSYSKFDNDLALLASETGGERVLLSATPDFSIVSDAIEDAILGTYTLRYCPSETGYDAKEHKVTITLVGNSLATDDGYFTPDLNQEYIVRHKNTISRSKAPVEDKKVFEVCFQVKDNIAPFAESVDLYHRQLGTALDFEVKPMNFDGASLVTDRTWCADIPTASVKYPAAEYYAVASYADGHELKSPPVNSEFFAWTQAVLPNYPPAITVVENTVIPELCSEYLLPSVTITDETVSVERATLWYKNKFAPSWSTIDLRTYSTTVGTANMVAVNVPLNISGDVTQYYIQATDNFGTIGEYGTKENPFTIETKKATSFVDTKIYTKIDFSDISFQCDKVEGLKAGDIVNAYFTLSCTIYGTDSKRLCGQLISDGTKTDEGQVLEVFADDPMTTEKDGTGNWETIYMELVRDGIAYDITEEYFATRPTHTWYYQASVHPTMTKSVEYNGEVVLEDDQPTLDQGTQFESYNGAGAISRLFTVYATSCSNPGGFGDVTVADASGNFTVTWVSANNIKVTYHALSNASARIRIVADDGKDFYFYVSGFMENCDAPVMKYGIETVANGDRTPSAIDGTNFGGVQQSVEHVYLLESNCPISIVSVESDNNQFNAYTLPGVETELRIAYLGTATASGEITVTLSDATVYTFMVAGESLVCNWGLAFGNVVLINGDDTPSYADGTDFGLLQSAETRTFTLNQANCVPNIAILDAYASGTEFSVTHTTTAVEVAYSANDDESSIITVVTSEGNFTFTVDGMAQDGTPVQSQPRFEVPVLYNKGYLDFDIQFSGNTCLVSADIVVAATGVVIASKGPTQVSVYWPQFLIDGFGNLDENTTYKVVVTVVEDCQNCTVTETHTITAYK
jgi:hypothetical protein